nr:MAG TPA: hypothetical protein [Microviridae sp.]
MLFTNFKESIFSRFPVNTFSPSAFETLKFDFI